MLKRTMDVVVSFAALLALTPLFFIVAVLIRLDSPGPIFYRGIRAGRSGKPFRMYKFRTMVVNAETTGGSSTPEDDPRLTRIGKFLRRHKLDELPQFINVLKGDMSVVGPRPQVLWAVERYTDEERILLTVRPGVTDPASIRFSNEGDVLFGSTDPDKDYMEKIHPEKTRLSLEYVRRRTIWRDIKIIIQTVWATGSSRVKGVEG